MKKIILSLLAAIALLFTGCDSFLDRPPLTTGTDETYWTSENPVRLFANGFYAFLS